MWYLPLLQSVAEFWVSLVWMTSFDRDELTALSAVIFEPRVFLQIRHIDDLAGAELAGSAGEGQWIAVGSGTFESVS